MNAGLCKSAPYRLSGSLRQLLTLVLVLVLGRGATGIGIAAMTDSDLKTQQLERKVADHPRAAALEGRKWLEEGLKIGDATLRLRGQRLLVMAMSTLEESADLIKLADEGLALARAQQDDQVICEFLAAKATALTSTGKHAEAIPLIDQAAEIAKKADLTRTLIGVEVARAYALGLVGNDTDALEILSKAHQSYLELGDAESARSTLSTIGNSYRREGSSRPDLLRALSYLQQSIFPDAEKSRRHDLSSSYYNMALIYEELKDLSNAKVYLDRSIAISTALDDSIGVAFCNARLGSIAAENGAWSDALQYANIALPELKRAGDTTMVFNVQRQRARALANVGRRKESLDALREAEKLRENVAWKNAAFLRTSASVYAALGEYEKAYRDQVLFQNAEAISLVQAREKDALAAQIKFELKQKEAENALLRAREKESDARRIVLALAIGLLLLTLGGLAFFVYRQNKERLRYATLALRDDLTGLPNRRSILRFAHAQIRGTTKPADSSLENEKNPPNQDAEPTCLALIDIDHFKAINDTYGHAIGDAVLTAFATTCQQQLRAEDRLGRYGGEEFLLVLPNFSLQQIAVLFDELRHAVQKIRVLGLPPSHVLAFSMGVAETDSQSDVDALIKRADDALYKAKNSGRDRLEFG